ncbi:hypothetical protein FKM82_023214, partial [Ascaphus truei]
MLPIGMQSPGFVDKEFVLVEHEFEYTAKDGRVISIKPNERYILLKRTNDHWWHVCPSNQARPFYIPAKYVKVLSSSTLPTNGAQPIRDHSKDVLGHVPATQYSYTFLPSDELVSSSDTLSTAKVKLVNAMSLSSLLSVLDISVVSDHPDKDAVQIPAKEQASSSSTFSPILRTFNNSKKMVNSNKRISFVCSPYPPTNIRPTQSLNDLVQLSPEASVCRPPPPGSHQQQRHVPSGYHNVLLTERGVLEQRQVAGSQARAPPAAQ